MTADAFAPAKINLTLHVTGQRDDGYHLLDSLVVFADVGDRLFLTPGETMTLEVSGPYSGGVPEDASNLVWRAAEAVGWTGHIKLEKNLPSGAGIGGGSSDAAAVLRALGGDRNKALSLGADVPVCLTAEPQRMQGIGEDLSPVFPMPPLHLVLVNPGVHLSTPSVFQGLDNRHNPGLANCSGWSGVAECIEWLKQQRNDLEPAACRLAPVISKALGALSGAMLARMTGSGSTCFGVFSSPDAAARAAREIAGQHPDWWVQATTTAGAPS